MPLGSHWFAAGVSVCIRTGGQRLSVEIREEGRGEREEVNYAAGLWTKQSVGMG